MSKKTIMLVCTAGMSTNMLVSRMQKTAEQEGIEADIFATSATDAWEQVKKRKIDVLMLGPQVRYMKEDFRQQLADQKIPVDVINMNDYGMVNGENILHRALSLLKND